MYVSRNDLHLHRKSSTISWCGPEVLLCSLLDPHQMALATTCFFTVLEQEISDTRAFWQRIFKDIRIKWHSLRLAFVLSWSSDEDINCKSRFTNVVYLPLVELTRRFLVAPRRTSWHIFHLFEFLGCFKHQSRVLDRTICRILNGVS